MREGRAETVLPGSQGRGAGQDQAAKAAKSALRVRAAMWDQEERLPGLTRARRASPDSRVPTDFQDSGEKKDSKGKLDPRVTQVSREGEADRDSQVYQGERASGATRAIRVYLASLEQKLKMANQEIQVRR